MIYRVLFLIISFLTSLEGNQYRVITTQSKANLGMFAAANQVLGQIYMFDTGQLTNVSGLTVDFDKYGLYYDPSHGPNWWCYYFEPINLGNRGDTLTVYPTEEQYAQAWIQRRMLPRSTAAQLVAKHIHVKNHIQRKIDRFVKRHFRNFYMIGIHYRGTDKSKEAPRIAYETVFEQIEKCIPVGKAFRLYVATDESSFLDEVKIRYGNSVVALDAHRSDGGATGVHFENKNNYVLGEEALMDCYLLSRCDLLIRTSSNLSLWSTYFNPNIPVILLNHRFMPTLEPE